MECGLTGNTEHCRAYRKGIQKREPTGGGREAAGRGGGRVRRAGRVKPAVRDRLPGGRGNNEPQSATGMIAGLCAVLLGEPHEGADGKTDSGTERRQGCCGGV